MDGFRKFIEDEEKPTILGTMGDELGVKPSHVATFYSHNPIMLADVKLADGTYHSLLPVKIVPGSIGDGNVTVVIDDTMSPNLNDKVLRKSGDEMKRVPNWEREEQKMVLPLSTKAKDSTGKITTLQDILSQGWSAAAQQGGMGGMGGPMGMM